MNALTGCFFFFHPLVRTIEGVRATLSLIIGILVVKTLIWSLSLGSGTSGGVLAPVFMIGAMGAWEGMLFPHAIPGFWAMLGLAAVVGGMMRSPLTGVIFTLELTLVWGALLPLVIAATGAYALSALALRRSVLTEKIARRGLHLTREYSTDPLETFFAREVMHLLDDGGGPPGAVVPWPVTVQQDATLQQVAYVFAETGLTRAPVIDPATRRPAGVITLRELLHARLHHLTEEHRRERLLAPSGLAPGRRSQGSVPG
jgi:hypothetical protein